jgi:hypothetical protein
MSQPARAEDPRRRRVAGALLLLAIVLVVLWWLLQVIAAVPTTIGMTSDSAIELIEARGFKASVTSVEGGGQPNRVFDQKPASGLHFKWTPIAIAVVEPGGRDADGADVSLSRDSSGRYTLEMGEKTDLGAMRVVEDEEMDPLYTSAVLDGRFTPRLQGLTKSKALKAVKRAGLSARLRYGPSTIDVSRGRVFYQDPAPGASLPKNKVVEVWISTGPLDITGDSPQKMPYPAPRRP